jgi:hypothetical protein
MDNWVILLHNHLMVISVLLFIIGMINILIAIRHFNKIMLNKNIREENNLKIENLNSDQLDKIRKESW